MPDVKEVAAAAPEGNAAANVDATAATPVAAVEPVSYALTLPENTVLDPKAIERYTTFAQAHKLSPEAAQAVIARTHEEVAETLQVLEAAIKPGGVKYEAQVAAWAKDSLNAHDLGNGDPDRLAAVVADAQLELAKAPPAIRDFLKESGYGSHPDAIRWLRSIGNRTKEKPLVQGDTGAAPAKERSYADRMYGAAEPVTT